MHLHPMSRHDITIFKFSREGNPSGMKYLSLHSILYVIFHFLSNLEYVDLLLFVSADIHSFVQRGCPCLEDQQCL